MKKSGNFVDKRRHPTCEFVGYAVCGAVRGFVRQVSKPHDWGNSWSYNRNVSDEYYGYRLEGGGYESLGARIAYETTIQTWSFVTMPIMAAFTAFSLYGDYFNSEQIR
jgi:hypothetical protein